MLDYGVDHSFHVGLAVMSKSLLRMGSKVSLWEVGRAHVTTPGYQAHHSTLCVVCRVPPILQPSSIELRQLHLASSSRHYNGFIKRKHLSTRSSRSSWSVSPATCSRYS